MTWFLWFIWLLHKVVDRRPSSTRVWLPKGGKHKCYSCGKMFRSPHPVYLFCCFPCGDINQQFRHLSRDLTGRVALVTGGRTKLGHQCCLKLLRAGAAVIATTRKKAGAELLYSVYPDYTAWQARLYLVELDLDTPDIVGAIQSQILQPLFEAESAPFAALDILVNCAAQTIRARDKPEEVPEQAAVVACGVDPTPSVSSSEGSPVGHGTGPPSARTADSTSTGSVEEKNRYGDSKFVSTTMQNSWQMHLASLVQKETEEVFRVNAVAPVLLILGF